MGVFMSLGIMDTKKVGYFSNEYRMNLVWEKRGGGPYRKQVFIRSYALPGVTIAG
jgi:hypothetical protein